MIIILLEQIKSCLEAEKKLNKEIFTTTFLLSAFSFLLVFYLISIIDETGWGTLGGVFLIICSIIIFFIDFFLKKKGIKDFVKIVGIEFLLIGIVAITSLYKVR